MHQRSRARRRFHTDRVVANRRRRYLREQPEVADLSHPRLAYGRLADRDPWDCGGRCMLCHADELLDHGARRARDRRQWRRDWGLAQAPPGQEDGAA